MESVSSRVVRIISEYAGIAEHDISPELSFETLGLDSLASLNIAHEIETDFGLDIPDEDVFKLRTVGDVIDGIEKRLRSEGDREH